MIIWPTPPPPPPPPLLTRGGSANADNGVVGGWPNADNRWQGGEGGQDPPNFADIICEQPLILCFIRFDLVVVIRSKGYIGLFFSSFSCISNNILVGFHLLRWDSRRTKSMSIINFVFQLFYLLIHLLNSFILDIVNGILDCDKSFSIITLGVWKHLSMSADMSANLLSM